MKKTISLVTLTLFLNFAFATNIFAVNKEAKFAENVKIQMSKLGVGQNAKVKLKLKDGSKVKGYISEIGDNQFAVTDAKTGQITQVAYPNVKQAKGNNLSTGVQLAIGLAVLVAVVLIIGSQVK